VRSRAQCATGILRGSARPDGAVSTEDRHEALRKRINEEFELRSTPLNTRLTYLRAIERFERHFGRSAAGLGRSAVREFLLHLTKLDLSAITHNVHATALWFLYARVLGRPKIVEGLPSRNVARKLPEVLTPAEVERLFAALASPRHRAIVMLAYGAGLRVGEICRLGTTDIDSKAGVFRVRHTQRGRPVGWIA
jgi:integrase